MKFFIRYYIYIFGKDIIFIIEKKLIGLNIYDVIIIEIKKLLNKNEF